MIHAFGLVELQARQVGQGGRGGLVEERAGHRLQGLPARPVE